MDLSVETAKYCQDIYGLEARLFVGNIPNKPGPETVVDNIHRSFATWANEDYVSVLMEFRGRYRVAWVQYKTRDEARRALACAQSQGVDILSRRIRVEWAKGRKNGQGKGHEEQERNQ
ncbi:hypothetical protein BJX96DRAFT_146160 [Aspergillus floccosus]